MLAVKNWFIQKNEIRSIWGKELEVVRETQKAILVSWEVEKIGSFGKYRFEHWIPKSCLTEEWEKDTSNFGYHDYLVEVLTKAYKNETNGLENKKFKSGRNVYDQTSFLHQATTKGLIGVLKEHEIEFMNRTEWNNR